mmetsp:Transcript_691/g.1347  ORF Transcript_691/g.1347 Transcript_691/m.1347 type:complete len:424 (+) Transcript_691:22-1293(+)
MIRHCSPLLRPARRGYSLAGSSRGVALSRLLEGTKVVELASVLAGPSVTQFLAELGATVIKVENPTTKGDVTRTWRLPSEPVSDVTAYFSCCNMNKSSIAVDVREPKGLKLVQDLACNSDIVIASYKPGDAEKFGLDFATLQARKPSLIYGQITGYGFDDPRAGYDAIMQAEAGFQCMNGFPHSPPVKMPVAIVDLMAAHQLKEAVLASLLRRERTGEGAFVSVSLLGAAVASLANQGTSWTIAGNIPQRTGSEHPSIVPYGTVFEDKNGNQVIFAVGSDKQFAALCQVLKLSALSSDPRFWRNSDRVEHRADLLIIMREAVAKLDRDSIIEELHRLSVPAGSVNNVRDAFKHPEAKRLIATHQGKAVGSRQIAFTEPGGSVADVTPPPHYAQHTRKVLREVLGLDDAAILNLEETGVVSACE